MELFTIRDLIKSMPRRWESQYRREVRSKRGKFYKTYARLQSLDLRTATIQDIADIIGNESWTELKCDQCGKLAEAVVTLGEQPYYESHTASICPDCLRKAVALLP